MSETHRNPVGSDPCEPQEWGADVTRRHGQTIAGRSDLWGTLQQPSEVLCSD